MAEVLQSLLLIGPAMALAGVAALVIYYFVFRLAPEPKGRPSIPLYVVCGLVLGFIGLITGAALGIGVACFILAAGNLCGLFGIFGLGPLLAGVTMIVFAHLWARNARRAPEP